MGKTPNYKIDRRREPGLTRKEMHEMEITRVKSDAYDHTLKQVNKYKKQLKEKEVLNKKLINISNEVIEEFILFEGVVTCNTIARLRDIIANTKEQVNND